MAIFYDNFGIERSTTRKRTELRHYELAALTVTVSTDGDIYIVNVEYSSGRKREYHYATKSVAFFVADNFIADVSVCKEEN